jgi:hypothetical protein
MTGLWKCRGAGVEGVIGMVFTTQVSSASVRAERLGIQDRFDRERHLGRRGQDRREQRGVGRREDARRERRQGLEARRGTAVARGARAGRRDDGVVEGVGRRESREEVLRQVQAEQSSACVMPSTSSAIKTGFVTLTHKSGVDKTALYSRKLKRSELHAVQQEQAQQRSDAEEGFEVGALGGGGRGIEMRACSGRIPARERW